MQEKLLHFIWQFQLYKSPLYDIEGRLVQVLHPGFHNTDAGPDFFKAQIKIANTLWVGSVEIHVLSSGWEKHMHHLDEKYNNTILHVVYEYDKAVVPLNMATVVLKDYVSDEILEKYKHRFIQHLQIPCEHSLHLTNDLVWRNWLERMFVSRIERKNELWRELLEKHQQNWIYLSFLKLMHNMGFKINEDAMLALAESIPFAALMHTKDNALQLEALLLGQAGMLQQDEHVDDYAILLEKEYHFLRRKFQLAPLHPKVWHLLRLRPPNFPTVRLAQVSYLLHHHWDILNTMFYADIQSIAAVLSQVKASEYWDAHYLIGKASAKEQVKQLGHASVENIMINTVIPLQMLYAHTHQTDYQQEQYLSFMQNIKSEKNNIIQEWERIGVKARNAFDSQALIELFNNYCKQKMCMKCAIGVSVIKNK